MSIVTTLPETFDQFSEARRKGFLTVMTMKEQGIPLVGTYCTFMPQEIAMAAGAVVVSLCSTSDETIEEAEKDLPRNLCPLIKSSYGFGKTDKCPYFYFSDLVVGETTCDGKKKMYEYMAEFKAVHVMQLPNSASDAASRALWKAEILRLQQVIEARFGAPISEAALREALNDEDFRRQAVAKATAETPEHLRGQFNQAVENTLGLFAKGGYIALNDFIANNIPQAEQEKMQDYFYQILYGAMNTLLDETIRRDGLSAWPQSDARNRFLINSLDAYTGLTVYPAPVLLQLEGYKEVRSSGLQMTRSPGASLVYIGSVLLVLGTVFMFYIREKRAWLLFNGGKVRFAMSSSRNERDLDKEFPEHSLRLQQLAEDLNHDRNQ